MLYADIVSGSPNSTKLIGTIAFDGKKVVVVKGKDNWYIQDLVVGGIRGPGGKLLTIKDGENFVKGLPAGISGSRVRAVLREK